MLKPLGLSQEIVTSGSDLAVGPAVQVRATIAVIAKNDLMTPAFQRVFPNPILDHNAGPRLVPRSRLSQQCRQLGDIRRDPPRNA
jgi:hypothetical protein